ANSRAALVTSGTATLETALLGVPQVVLYRSNGSKLAYNIMRKLIKVDYISLPNLIADREIIPELILHNCTPDSIADALTPLLTDTPVRQAQLDGYADMREQLGSSTAAVTTASKIIETLLNE
ncbi:MAG: lipid-A-disaccharide synthase, partial [Muribaculaceae bacterium]|nr:lipid-A-disaccharide synthase [Muribaculaceae bacterium]